MTVGRGECLIAFNGQWYMGSSCSVVEYLCLCRILSPQMIWYPLLDPGVLLDPFTGTQASVKYHCALVKHYWLICPCLTCLLLNADQRIIFPDNTSAIICHESESVLPDSQIINLFNLIGQPVCKRSKIICDSVWFICTVHWHVESFSVVSHTIISNKILYNTENKSTGWDEYFPRIHCRTQNC